MKKLIVLAVASMFATTAFAGDMKWSGHAGMRYRNIKNKESLASTTNVGTLGAKNTNEATTKQYQVDAGLGATGGWENVEWGAGVRTTGSATSSYANIPAGNADVAIGLDQAWFRYLKDFGDIHFNVTLGRQMNALAYDNMGQGLFDNDNRWDGFAWQWKMGMFGFNAVQYITGAFDGTNGSQAATYSKTEALEAAPGTVGHFNYMIGWQPHMTWKFTDEIETFFSIGYYVWSDNANENRSRGGLTAAIENLNTGTPADITAYSLRVHNPRQWHFYNKWSLPFNLKLALEYVMNKKTKLWANSVNVVNGAAFNAASTNTPEVSRSMFSGSLMYGSLEKAHDFTLGYTYTSKGIASVINTYTNGDFLADNKGHVISAGYALADNFHLGIKGFFMKEKEKISASGNQTTDGLAYQGANAGQEMKTTAWHFSTSVMF